MGKIAFVFSGQGAQYSGMGKELCENVEACKKVFDTADNTLNRDISGLCFSGSDEDLGITSNTQPSVLAVDIAAANALIDAGIVPDAVAGFSLGEYAALVTAGVIALEDVFPLIQLRADSMQKAVPLGEGAMAAVIGKAPEEVEELCKRATAGYVIASNYNSPKQTVISGSKAGVDQVVEIATQESIRVIPLSVSVPSHCELMKPAADVIKAELQNYTLSDAAYPVYMNVDGKAYTEVNTVVENLYKQLFNPIHWTDTILNMVEAGVDTFIECGPGKTLSGLIKKTVKEVKILHVEDMESLQAALEAIG